MDKTLYEKRNIIINLRNQHKWYDISLYLSDNDVPEDDRWSIARELADNPAHEILPVLKQNMNSSSDFVRQISFYILIRLPDTDIKQELINALHDSDHEITQKSIEILAGYGNDIIRQYICPLIKEGGCYSFEEYENRPAIQGADPISFIADKRLHIETQLKILRIVSNINDEDSTSIFASGLKDKDYRIRKSCASHLADKGSDKYLEELAAACIRELFIAGALDPDKQEADFPYSAKETAMEILYAIKKLKAEPALQVIKENIRNKVWIAKINQIINE